MAKNTGDTAVDKAVKTTAEWMVEALIEQGVDTVFGIPGAHTYALTDAMAKASNRIRFVHSRHEQGAGYMAYGYAKSTGKPGVFTVVPGPGVLNAGAALCTGYGANAPMMCLTGNIMSHLIGQGRGQLHELPDQLATLRGLTKWSQRIDHPSAAPEVMAQGFARMVEGRPRPVAVEVPWDVFGQAAPAAEGATKPAPAPIADPAQLDKAAQMIRAAKRPMIMVGGGAADAGAEVLALARKIGAPVVAHRSGKGIVPADDPLSMDLVAGYDWWRETDLLIGIGSRLELQYMRWQWQPEGLKLLRLDIDPTEMVRLKPDLGLVCDAGPGAAALTAALEGLTPPDRSADIAAAQARAAERIAEIQPQVSYLEALRRALPRDGFLVEEVSQMGFAGRFAFPSYHARGYISCGYQDNLGFGYNTALGVKVANPERAVVSVSGDGGFMFGVQELATAMQHGIGVVAVVFNNNAYGNVRRDQMTVMEGRRIGADLVNPDFVALAQSFGMAAERVDSPEALEQAVSRALASGAPALIEVPVETGSETSPWPLLHPAPHG